MIRQDAAIIAWIDGEPIGRGRLDDRLAALRAGPRAAALPADGTAEARQFVRWTAHVVCTEELCRREVSNPPARAAPLDALGAIQLGSINASAWWSDPAVGAACDRLFPDRATHDVAPERRWWRLSYAAGNDRPPTAVPPLSSLGWTTLDDLPQVLRTAARTGAPGVTIGPLVTGNRWYYVRIDEIAERAGVATHHDQGDRLRSFARWLDLRRGRSLVMAAGFEHPGDPAQPDYTHHH